MKQTSMPSKAKAQKKRAKRKGPDEFRCIKRAAKVKDGRCIAMLFVGHDDPKSHTVEPCYWDKKTQRWWPANIDPRVAESMLFEDAEAMFGTAIAWKPLAEKSCIRDALRAYASKPAPKQPKKHAEILHKSSAQPKHQRRQFTETLQRVYQKGPRIFATVK